jgi:DNA-binding MarR family transcriptional regulator
LTETSLTPQEKAKLTPREQAVLDAMDYENPYKNTVKYLAGRLGLTSSQVSTTLRGLSKKKMVGVDERTPVGKGRAEKIYLPHTRKGRRVRAIAQKTYAIKQKRVVQAMKELDRLKIEYEKPRWKELPGYAVSIPVADLERMIRVMKRKSK